MDLERPLRHPDTDSAPLMNKRARWLVLVGFLFPGSAQVLAGNRKLGRFGLGATILMLLIAVISVIGLLFFRTATLSVFTNSLVLLVVQWLILGYAVMWLILGFDTLRLARLVKVTPGWRVPVAIVSVILTVLPVAGAAYASVTVGSARGAFSDIFGGGAPAVEPVDGRYNIMLLGVDPGEDREGMRPDSISLVSVDAETGQSVIVGLPRELTQMPFDEASPLYPVYPDGFCSPTNNYEGDGYCFTTGYLNAMITELSDSGSPSYEGMFAEATSQGSTPGIEAMKDAVSGATGLDVQFYVLIDMAGFSSLIDALGGVTVDVQQPIPLGGYEDPYTGEWVEGDSYIEPGVQTLNGEYALMFARVRHGLANGDFDRMQHQRQLQAAILAQMNPANVLLRFQELAGAGSELVKTDIPESMLGRFVDLAARAKDHTPVSVEIAPPAIDPEYVDYALVHQMVADAVAAASPPQEAE
ncbi:LCP family protein [Leucobacter rhizosphaerae]|uniref:LCP family protein n=1 Tax=Leucobacter rhizosphaerae TaxID=2932245 RepID=A0ABY4G043_9MICO|nr:LCP family protein [Leucobacter rhizosphaerae]UOQ61933.1 LCP family protein [Leucobacter rhizosphaerae]